MATATRSLVDEYRRRTPESARLAERARACFPSGVSHDSWHLEPYPPFFVRAEGSRKWDADGHEYVDYAGGHGALLLGHQRPEVVAAVNGALARGTHFGGCHPLQVEWAEAVRALVPSAERVRFTSSGTEATLLALRLARAHTGRAGVVRFLGHFHGWHDHMAFGVTSHFDGSPTPGVLADVARHVVLAPPNDVDATRAALDSGDVAAAIIEPTGASWGQVPVAPAFLHALRELTAERGIVLVFDEVISGFRCAPGGAQQALGIRPDLTTLAKILAGGLPGGAVCGRADLMGALDFAAAANGPGKVPHQGTFNANPLSAAAGIATLRIIGATDACERANAFAARLRAALDRVLVDERVPWAVYGSYSGFHLFTNPDRRPIRGAEIDACRYDHRVLKHVDRRVVHKLRIGMLVHGVDLFSWPGGPTSSAHTDDDLERTVDALRATVRRLRDEGDLG